SHVEEIAHLAASALDLALAAPFAAIVIVRRDAQQGGDRLVAHLSQFRHRRDQAGGGDLGKSWHALDDLGELGKMRCRLDHGSVLGQSTGRAGKVAHPLRSTIRTSTAFSRSALAHSRSYPPLASITAAVTLCLRSQEISLRRPSAVLGNVCRRDNARMHAST